MNVFIIFIGIIIIVLAVAMWFRYRDEEEEELVEKSPGVFYKVWHIRTRSVLALILGLFVILIGLVI